MKKAVAIGFAAMLLWAGDANATATDLPFIQIGGVTISIGDSPAKVRDAFGVPEWEETQEDVRIWRRPGGRSALVREVTVWWYTLDDGWGRPNNYGFYILEGEVVRIRRTGW